MEKKCIICNKIYNVRGIKAKTNSKFCSCKCKSQYQHLYLTRENSPRWKGGIREKKCICCGKIFKWEDNKKPYISFLKQKTCSVECKSKMQKLLVGPLSNNWKGGHSKRDGTKQSEWSKQILKRDNYTCQECGKRGGDLHAHHIKEYIDYPELQWKLDNGKTLCLGCHYKTYKFYRNQFTEICKK